MVEIAQGEMWWAELPAPSGDFDRLYSQKGDNLVYPVGRSAQCPGERAMDFGEHGFAEDQLMLSEHRLQEVGAESASRECGKDDVRVQRDPHDRLRRTSSSVR